MKCSTKAWNSWWVRGKQEICWSMVRAPPTPLFIKQKHTKLLSSKWEISRRIFTFLSLLPNHKLIKKFHSLFLSNIPTTWYQHIWNMVRKMNYFLGQVFHINFVGHQIYTDWPSHYSLVVCHFYHRCMFFFYCLSRYWVNLLTQSMVNDIAER